MRMSASVMARLLQLIGENNEILVGHPGDGLCVPGSHRPPDIQRVLEMAETLCALLKTRLLGFKHAGIQRWRMLNEVRGRVTKTGHGVVDKYLGPADQAT